MTPAELADQGDTLRAAAIADEWEVEEGWRQLWYFVRWGEGGSDWMQVPDKATAEVIVWWHNHWPELAAMLRRLTAAEDICRYFEDPDCEDDGALTLFAIWYDAIALRRPVKPPYPTDEMLEADAILDAGGELP